MWLESVSASTSIAVARRAALLLAHPQPSTLLNNLHSCTYFLCVHNSAVSGCECGGCGECGLMCKCCWVFYTHSHTQTHKHTLTPHCAWFYATLKMRVLISLSECGFYICICMCIYVHVYVLISC